MLYDKERLINLLKEGDLTVLDTLRKEIQRQNDFLILKDIFEIEANLAGDLFSGRDFKNYSDQRMNEIHDAFDKFFTDTVKGKIFDIEIKAEYLPYDRTDSKYKRSFIGSYSIKSFFRDSYGNKKVILRSLYSFSNDQDFFQYQLFDTWKKSKLHK